MKFLQLTLIAALHSSIHCASNPYPERQSIFLTSIDISEAQNDKNTIEVTEQFANELLKYGLKGTSATALGSVLLLLIRSRNVDSKPIDKIVLELEPLVDAGKPIIGMVAIDDRFIAMYVNIISNNDYSILSANDLATNLTPWAKFKKFYLALNESFFEQASSTLRDTCLSSAVLLRAQTQGIFQEQIKERCQPLVIAYVNVMRLLAPAVIRPSPAMKETLNAAQAKSEDLIATQMELLVEYCRKATNDLSKLIIKRPQGKKYPFHPHHN